MAENGFGSFEDDSFGDSSFGSDNFGDFDFGSSNDSFDFESNSDGFSGFDSDNSGFGDDSQSGFSGNNNGGFDNQSNDLDFSGQFDDSVSQDNSEGGGSLKKTAIIAVILGVVVLLAVFFIAGLINKKANASKNDGSTVTVVENPQTNISQNVNADNIMQSGNEPQSNTTVVNNGNTVNVNNNTSNNSNKTDGWTEITSYETIEFYSEYQEHMFTITEIKHYAKLTDNTLVVKTELTGSLSGMSGTYKIDVPYNKGCLLNIGNEFSVKVLKGSFNGKNVVGDIKY